MKLLKIQQIKCMIPFSSSWIAAVCCFNYIKDSNSFSICWVLCEISIKYAQEKNLLQRWGMHMLLHNTVKFSSELNNTQRNFKCRE